MEEIFLCCLLLCVFFVSGEYFDTYTGVRIPRRRYEELRNLSLVPWCAIEVAKCDPHEPRRMDLSCNNLKHPTRGAYLTPFSRMLPADFSSGGKPRTAASGRPLPAPRALRVDLMSDGRVASKEHTQMVVNYAVFVTGEITSVHDTVNYVAVIRDCCLPSGATAARCSPLSVREDDVHLRRSAIRCLNLTTPVTFQDLGCVADDVPPERINTVAPMLDLSSVYGNDAAGAAKGRLWEGGRMRAEMVRGKEWPPSGSPLCVNNEPPNENRCHDIPAAGSNSLLGLNLMFIWFYRQHNSIAAELATLNPCWDDDKLYYTAREINIAFANQIFYYEYLPEIMGREFLLKNQIIFNTMGHVDDYDASLEPRVSIEYVTGTRWFHSIQEGRLKLYSQKGVLYDEKLIVDFTLRTGALAVNNTLEGLTQGVFRQPGAAVDAVVDPDMGERVLGRLQLASDVVAADIMKGRLLGLPPYARYRQLCQLPHASTFNDLRQWMDGEQVDALERHYESVDDIDVMAGVFAERSGPAALVPPTLACLMADQLRRWRRADRFWYEHPDHPQAFTREQLREIRRMTTSTMLCRHGDGIVDVQRNVYRLPKHSNDMVPCSKIDVPDLSVFKDATCRPSHVMQQHATQQHATQPQTKQQHATQPQTKQQQLSQDHTTKEHAKIQATQPLTKQQQTKQQHATQPQTKQQHATQPQTKQQHATQPQTKQQHATQPQTKEKRSKQRADQNSALNPFIQFIQSIIQE